jgi:osmotically-inducible protein OsmY
MFPTQITRTDPNELIRCGDANQSIVVEQKERDKNTKTDIALTYEVDRALWQDAAFKAAEYDNIDVQIRDGIAYLYGHVSSLSHRRQAQQEIQSVDGILGINNHLIPDDRLLTEVATALGQLESTYNCQFFTGVSHGVVLVSGNVDNVNIKLLAEKRAASNPNVRGVINSIHVTGSDLDLPEEPFLQPIIGEEIFFLDGISGRVRQVIINPDNRRVVAMTLQGRFANQRQKTKALNNGEAQPSEQLIVIAMNSVRYLTKVSGFLYISSKEKDRYMDFDRACFFIPKKDWKTPYPYCLEDVLFLIKQRDVDDQNSDRLSKSPMVVGLEDQLLGAQLPTNDSLGG